MITDTRNGRIQREPTLLDQTVVLIGGSAGIGLETARRARAEGADVVLTGPDPDRLARAAHDVDARSTPAFDAADPARLAQFFDELPSPIDHVMVTAGAPYYSSLADMDFARAHRNIDEHFFLALHVARESAARHRRCRPRARAGGLAVEEHAEGDWLSRSGRQHEMGVARVEPIGTGDSPAGLLELDVLAPRALANARADTTTAIAAEVARMRAHGVAWPAIGNASGMTRQAALQRFSQGAPQEWRELILSCTMSRCG